MVGAPPPQRRMRELRRPPYLTTHLAGGGGGGRRAGAAGGGGSGGRRALRPWPIGRSGMGWMWTRSTSTTIDWSATTNHTTPHRHLMGGHQRAYPRRGRQIRSSAMGDRSAHNVSGGPRPPREDATSEAPVMEEGGGQGGVWVRARGRPNRMYFSFVLGVLFFRLSGGLAGRRSGLTRIVVGDLSAEKWSAATMALRANLQRDSK